MIESNDPVQASTAVTISGEVDVFVQITPERPQLTGILGKPIQTQVVITPFARYPFKIIKASFEKGMNATVTVEEKKNAENTTEYLLTLKNTRKNPGLFYDNLILKTDSPVRRELKIGVSGNIQKPKDETDRSGEAEKGSPSKPIPAPAAKE